MPLVLTSSTPDSLGRPTPPHLEKHHLDTDLCLGYPLSLRKHWRNLQPLKCSYIAYAVLEHFSDHLRLANQLGTETEQEQLTVTPCETGVGSHYGYRQLSHDFVLGYLEVRMNEELSSKVHNRRIRGL